MLPRRTLLAIAVSASVYTIVQGLSYPLLAILLEQTGAREWEIGLNAAMLPLGMVTAGVGAPKLVRAMGARAVGISSFGVAAVCLIAIKVLEQEPLIWMPLRFVMGFALACIFVVTDAWINELTPDHTRGRVLAIYSAFIAVGFAVGPGILAVVGSDGWMPFIIGACCTLAAVVPLLAFRENLPDTVLRQGRESGWSFLPLAPMLLVGVGVVALAEQAVFSLLPVWAIAQDFDTRTANIMLVVMTIGGVVLPLPLGWLADRLSRRLLIAGCAAASAGCAWLLGSVGGTGAVLWPLLFIFGGAYYGIYVLSLIRLGQMFSGQFLVAGTAAFGAVWGLGGIIGSPVVGGVMSWFGPLSLPVTLAALFGGFLLITIASQLLSRKK